MEAVGYTKIKRIVSYEIVFLKLGHISKDTTSYFSYYVRFYFLLFL